MLSYDLIVCVGGIRKFSVIPAYKTIIQQLILLEIVYFVARTDCSRFQNINSSLPV